VGLNIWGREKDSSKEKYKKMKLETQRKIALNLSLLRNYRGMSQAHIASLVGISRSAYVTYELGNRIPDAEVLFNIASRFGISMDKLFESDQKEFLALISAGDSYDDELLSVINTYKALSPFAKGMLAERIRCLKEWDKSISDNRETLLKRKANNG
jgi:transcriptional regulator with XRE-family HTH domain